MEEACNIHSSKKRWEKKTRRILVPAEIILCGVTKVKTSFHALQWTPKYGMNKKKRKLENYTVFNKVIAEHIFASVQKKIVFSYAQRKGKKFPIYLQLQREIN